MSKIKKSITISIENEMKIKKYGKDFNLSEFINTALNEYFKTNNKKDLEQLKKATEVLETELMVNKMRLQKMTKEAEEEEQKAKRRLVTHWQRG